MAISQVSMNSVATNPTYTNPYAKIDQSAAAAQGQMNQNAQKTTQQLRTDTVTLSQQAIQKSNQAQSNTAALAQNRNQVQNQMMVQNQNQSQSQAPAQTQNKPQTTTTTQQTLYQYPPMSKRMG